MSTLVKRVILVTDVEYCETSPSVASPAILLVCRNRRNESGFSVVPLENGKFRPGGGMIEFFKRAPETYREGYQAKFADQIVTFAENRGIAWIICAQEYHPMGEEIATRAGCALEAVAYPKVGMHRISSEAEISKRIEDSLEFVAKPVG